MAFSEYLTNELHKQHLNLSQEAWKTIDNDIFEFTGKNPEKGKSSFLNQVFMNYHDQESFPGDLDKKISDKREEYRKLLLQQKELKEKPELLQEIVDILLEGYIEQIKQQLQSYPKGIGKKYRIDNDCFRLLCDIPEDGYETQIYQRPGKYLKMIFESYSRLSYLQREWIYFYKEVKKLKWAIDYHYEVIIETAGKQYYVAPYKILPNSLYTHYYLVGNSRPVSNVCMNDKEKTVSFRLSRLRVIMVNEKKKRVLPKKEIEDKISKNGVQFLLCDNEIIQVRLTAEGIRKYNSLLYLRPAYKEIIEENIYCFTATRRQIMVYFFKFGKDAEIITPDDLRREFQIAYKEAEENYRNG